MSRTRVGRGTQRAGIRRLFAVVAPRYRMATRLLSLGCDQGWKKSMVDALPAVDTPVIVDAASGTGDILQRLLRRFPRATAVGIDLSPHMIARAPLFSHAVFNVQDMNDLGLKSGCADMLTGGYALRNAPDCGRALEEMSRVLKPGGTLALLDFFRCTHPLLWILEYAVLKFWGCLWGLILHCDPRVYGYIAESLKTMPCRRDLYTLLSRSGFAFRCH